MAGIVCHFRRRGQVEAERGGNFSSDLISEYRCRHHSMITRLRKAATSAAISAVSTAVAITPATSCTGAAITLQITAYQAAPKTSSAAAIAQLGERQTEDLKVPGSIPGLGRQQPCVDV